MELKALHEAEEIVWRGRPNQMRVFVWAMGKWPVALFVILFGGLFAGLALYTSDASNNALRVFIGMVAIIGGLILAMDPVLYFKAACRTRYAVTNRRILIIEAGNERDAVSITRNDIIDYLRSDRGDGSGDIRLRKTVQRSNKHGTSYSTEFTDALWGVDDVRGAALAIAALRTS